METGNSGTALANAPADSGVRQEFVVDDGKLFDLGLTDEQQMLQGAAEDIAANKLRPAAEEADTNDATPAELVNAIHELGVTQLGVHEDLGGATSERSAVSASLIAEALAHGDLSIAFTALAPAAVSTALGLWGDSSQQASYLPGFVGESVKIAALAVQEKRALFNPFELKTTATRDGSDFVLNGAKSLVPRAGEAELLVIAADLEGSPAFFIVELPTDGVSVEAEPAMGLRAATTSTVTLSDVRVPAAALLGGADPQVYSDAIALGRLAWASLATGTTQAVLDYVIPYVKERYAFGEPIANRQSVAFAISNIAIESDAIRLATRRGATRADRGDQINSDATKARWLVTEHGMNIGSMGVQLLGGHGFIKDHPVERWYRDLRIAGMYEGGLLI